MTLKNCLNSEYAVFDPFVGAHGCVPSLSFPPNGSLRGNSGDMDFSVPCPRNSREAHTPNAAEYISNLDLIFMNVDEVPRCILSTLRSFFTRAFMESSVAFHRQEN